MMKRVLLPFAAGAAIFSAAALVPAPAGAHWASAPMSITHGNAQGISDVVEVRRRGRHRGWSRHHWRGRHFARPYYYAPYAYAPRRCGYVWNHRLYRHIWQCW